MALKRINKVCCEAAVSRRYGARIWWYMVFVQRQFVCWLCGLLVITYLQYILSRSN